LQFCNLIFWICFEISGLNDEVMKNDERMEEEEDGENDEER
jgi:hypothetical protein